MLRRPINQPQPLTCRLLQAAKIQVRHLYGNDRDLYMLFPKGDHFDHFTIPVIPLLDNSDSFLMIPFLGVM